MARVKEPGHAMFIFCQQLKVTALVEIIATSRKKWRFSLVSALWAYAQRG